MDIHQQLTAIHHILNVMKEIHQKDCQPTHAKHIHSIYHVISHFYYSQSKQSPVLIRLVGNIYSIVVSTGVGPITTSLKVSLPHYRPGTALDRLVTNKLYKFAFHLHVTKKRMTTTQPYLFALLNISYSTAKNISV